MKRKAVRSARAQHIREGVSQGAEPMTIILYEVEANLWHTARNLFIYSEEERVPAVYEQNAREAPQR